jgi:hypothetical protein
MLIKVSVPRYYTSVEISVIVCRLFKMGYNVSANAVADEWRLLPF